MMLSVRKKLFFVAGFVLPLVVTACAPILASLTHREAVRLRVAATQVTAFTNPAPITDNFTQARPDIWPLAGINGDGTFKQATSFDAGEFQYGTDGLTMYMHNDPNWDEEGAKNHYNNIALFGMRGFRPTEQEDVVMSCSLTISDPFYGTTGCVFEPVGTVADSGFIHHFDMFGVTLAGPKGSSLLGIKDIICGEALDYKPVVLKAIKGVDIHQENLTFVLRLIWQDSQNMTGTVSVDGLEKCRIKDIPLFTAETQIWNDDYYFRSISYDKMNGGEKWVRYSQVSVWTEPRSK